ncbi:Nitrogen regulatory protein [gamma proteobacterium HdN1]|nr:Nitrogen regulatory protein [gamma proteobacterium HdN1]
MSGYLLDTNILSDLIRNPAGPAACRIEQVGPKEIFTSIIVASELRYGCAKKRSPKLLAKVEGILETIPVLPLDIPADVEYGGIRIELEAAGQPIDMNDLLIAAHAHALGLTLVTDNTREFSRIRGLNVENWLER